MPFLVSQSVFVERFTPLPHPTVPTLQADSTAFFTWVDDILGFRESGNINYSVEHVEKISVDCYVAQTELT